MIILYKYNLTVFKNTILKKRKKVKVKVKKKKKSTKSNNHITEKQFQFLNAIETKSIHRLLRNRAYLSWLPFFVGNLNAKLFPQQEPFTSNQQAISPFDRELYMPTQDRACVSNSLRLATEAK